MNKNLFITGGTGKVGTQLIKHFFKQGFDIFFTLKSKNDSNPEIEKLKSLQTRNKIYGIVIDLMSGNATLAIMSTLKKEKIYPNYLINCARNTEYLKINPDGLSKRQNWLGELTLDVIVPYELSMHMAKDSKSKLKHIINVSSIYGVVPPNPNLYKNPTLESPIQYGVAKAAQIHLTKELAIRLAPQKIQVNCVSFGGIEGRVDDNFKKRYSKLCPLGKMLKEEEVIGAIDFLISEKSIGITGHNLIVDGGWTVW